MIHDKREGGGGRVVGQCSILFFLPGGHTDPYPDVCVLMGGFRFQGFESSSPEFFLKYISLLIHLVIFSDSMPLTVKFCGRVFVVENWMYSQCKGCCRC